MTLPCSCDGCGEPFTVRHALDCLKGGLVTKRQNEIKDAMGDIAAMAYSEALKEPIMRDRDDKNDIPALVADLGVRGMWQRQAMALIDV